MACFHFWDFISFFLRFWWNLFRKFLIFQWKLPTSIRLNIAIPYKVIHFCQRLGIIFPLTQDDWYCSARFKGNYFTDVFSDSFPLKLVQRLKTYWLFQSQHWLSYCDVTAFSKDKKKCILDTNSWCWCLPTSLKSPLTTGSKLVDSTTTMRTKPWKRPPLTTVTWGNPG